VSLRCLRGGVVATSPSLMRFVSEARRSAACWRRDWRARFSRSLYALGQKITFTSAEFSEIAFACHTTFPTCRAHYPGGSNGCTCRLLPRSCSLPQMAGGSASALSLSRPAQASLALQPAGLLSRPRRPLSRGSGPSGYPAEPLVSYQINRQFSGWLLPPQVIRAFRAHCHRPTFPRMLRRVWLGGHWRARTTTIGRSTVLN